MAEKKKLKLKVAKVESEKNPDGIVILRMTLKTEKGEYIRGVKLEDWENPQKKRSITRTWLNNIGKMEAHKELSEDEINAKIETFKGEELTDE